MCGSARWRVLFLHVLEVVADRTENHGREHPHVPQEAQRPEGVVARGALREVGQVRVHGREERLRQPRAVGERDAGWQRGWNDPANNRQDKHDGIRVPLHPLADLESHRWRGVVLSRRCRGVQTRTSESRHAHAACDAQCGTRTRGHAGERDRSGGDEGHSVGGGGSDDGCWGSEASLERTVGAVWIEKIIDVLI